MLPTSGACSRRSNDEGGAGCVCRSLFPSIIIQYYLSNDDIDLKNCRITAMVLLDDVIENIGGSKWSKASGGQKQSRYRTCILDVKFYY